MIIEWPFDRIEGRREREKERERKKKGRKGRKSAVRSFNYGHAETSGALTNPLISMGNHFFKG